MTGGRPSLAHPQTMLRSLAGLFLFALSGCAVSMHAVPITLVGFVIDGSPRLVPGGPAVYVAGQYRGQPVDGRFRIELPVGRHEVRLQGGAAVYWQGDVEVVATAAPQVVEIRYDVPVDGG